MTQDTNIIIIHYVCMTQDTNVTIIKSLTFLFEYLHNRPKLADIRLFNFLIRLTLPCDLPTQHKINH